MEGYSDISVEVEDKDKILPIYGETYNGQITGRD